MDDKTKKHILGWCKKCVKPIPSSELRYYLKAQHAKRLGGYCDCFPVPECAALADRPAGFPESLWSMLKAVGAEEADALWLWLNSNFAACDKIIEAIGTLYPDLKVKHEKDVEPIAEPVLPDPPPCETHGEAFCDCDK